MPTTASSCADCPIKRLKKISGIFFKIGSRLILMQKTKRFPTTTSWRSRISSWSTPWRKPRRLWKRKWSSLNSILRKGSQNSLTRTIWIFPCPFGLQMRPLCDSPPWLQKIILRLKFLWRKSWWVSSSLSSSLGASTGFEETKFLFKRLHSQQTLFGKILATQNKKEWSVKLSSLLSISWCLD